MNLDYGLSLCRRGLAVAAITSAGIFLASVAGIARGDQSAQERAAQWQAMTPEKKEELLRKKQRFDDLQPEEQNRLRELHASIKGDAHAEQLEQTMARYNQWLATLTSPQRAALTDIADPAERIVRIKELMQQQAEQRFREFLPNLPDEERKVINKWVGDFVTAHEEDIRKLMRPEWREKVAESHNDEARRRNLAMNWGWQFRRREPGTPVPTAEEFEQLFKALSAETRREIDQTATAPKERQALLEELVRRATFSRFLPQVGREELLKFYTDMKADDSRRERLEPLEGDALYRELHGMYIRERFGGPQGPPGQRGGPPWGGPPGERSLFKGPGKRPPGPPPGEGPPPPK
jgi:hypothetical protein